MWRHIASNALTLLIVVLVVAGGIIAWGQSQWRSAGPLETATCLRVAPGATMRQVSDDLARDGAISNPAIFRIGADYTDRSSELKAGSFRIPEGAAMSEIVDIVTRGGQSTCGTEIVYRVGVTDSEVRVRELDPASNRFEVIAEFDPASDPPPDVYEEARDEADTRYRVSVAEGTTSWHIVNALRQVDFLTGDIAAVPDEGVLAPDSYEVSPGGARVELLDRMAELQTERLAEAWRNRADDLPIDTPEEALILASIIEKETGVPEERQLVASVFANRLERGMRLQTDPTVIYGVTGGEGALGRGLRQSELDARTPYNTYVIEGLPPTPIANPGLASIEAAVDPGESRYLYFVADGTGGHAFAETLEEHNANVARWRRVEAESAGQ